MAKDYESGQDAIKTAREQAQHADDAADIAGADPNTQSIKSGLDETDPQRTSQSLKQMYDEFEKIKNMLASSMPMVSASVSGGGGGGSGAGAGVSSGIKRQLKDALTGALALLTKKYGYTSVITAFNTALYNHFGDLNSDFQPLVTSSLLSLYNDVIKHGERNIPVLELPAIIYGSKTPSPLVASPPDHYTQQYYTSSNDPYPGFVQWKGIVNNDYVYTIRTTDYPPFNTSTDEVMYTSQRGLANDLDQYVYLNNLTVDILNTLLNKWCVQIQQQADNKSMGNNSSNLLSQLLPILQSLISMAQSQHLPNSVLDQGKMNTLLQNHQTQKTKNKLMSMWASNAVKTDQISSLLNPSMMQGLLSGLLNKQPSQQNMAQFTNNANSSVQSVINNANTA